MKQFNKNILTASVLITLGSASNAWADPTAAAISGSDATAIASATVIVNPSATATDAVANNGGIALSDHSNSSVAAASAQGSAAANNGSTATTLNIDNSDRSQANANGIGSAAANNGGTATSTYRVSNQSLSGTVTGNSSILPTNATELSSIPLGNNINHSLIGNAGITQTVQNSGGGLVQQSVLVDGAVNVTQGSAAINVN